MTDPTLHDELHDNPYLALSEVDDDARWAFGGGFDDPLEGMDTTVPTGLEAGPLARVCLGLADESLLLAQTLLRWCTHAPELEEEVALANVALDLLGQARILYARAAAADPSLVPVLPEGSPVPDDDRLAYFRDAADFHAPALVVMPDRDFAVLVLRLAALASWRDALWRELLGCPDPVLAAVARRAVLEVAYHRDLSVRWVQVLAGGTEESARRLAVAADDVLPRVDQLAQRPPGVVGEPWEELWARAGRRFAESWREVSVEGVGVSAGSSGGDVAAWRDDLVAELQSVARDHPMGRW